MGYENKKISTSFQAAVIDAPGSDCGTKKLFKIHLTDKIYNLYKYRYVKDGNNLVELNDSNKDKFMDKIVYMRSPLYCKGDKICSKCAGQFFYKLGVENIGLTTNSIGGVLLNASMKSFHDSTVYLKELDIEDYISD